MRSIETLRVPAAIFAATWLLHTADHVRRGLADTSDGVTWAGTIAAVLAAVGVTLIVVRHESAALVGAVVFPSIAVGVSAAHLAPGWGYFSEPLVFGATTDAWSLVAVLPEIAAAAWLGWLSFRVARAQGYRLSGAGFTVADA